MPNLKQIYRSIYLDNTPDFSYGRHKVGLSFSALGTIMHWCIYMFLSFPIYDHDTDVNKR